MSSSDREHSGRDADVEKQSPIESHSPVDGYDSPRTGTGGRGMFGGRGLGHILSVKDGEVYNPDKEQKAKWYQKLVDAGFEDNGIKPVPVGARTNTQYSNLFTIFFTSMLSLLP